MRPEARPEQPYTISEVLDRVEQHFLIENNPRCVDSENPLRCIYGKTGCAVGCLLTKEDAATLDSLGYFSSDHLFKIFDNNFDNNFGSNGHLSQTEINMIHSILESYFSEDRNLRDLLDRLQRAHDSARTLESLKNNLMHVIEDSR